MKNTSIYTLLFLATTTEVFSQTYLQRYGSKDMAAILYLLCGIAVGVLPLLKRVSTDVRNPVVSGRWQWETFGILALGVFYFGHQAIQGQALDYKFADMLPIIQIMGERWLAGGDVYAIIPEIWNGMQPIYLPAMWMPYLPAIATDIDIRWVNISLILMASGIALRFWQKKQSSFVQTYGVYIPLLLLLSYIFINYTTFVTISEEPMVVGFYALLAFGILSKRPVVIVIALAACLLSRYALVFWAATYFTYLLWQNDRRRTLLIIGGTGILSLLVLYVSQGIYQLELFYSLKDAYLDSFQNPDVAWRTKNTVSKNIGLARFIPFEKLIYLHKSVFWGSLFLPPLLYVWYHLKLKDYIKLGWFAICSLKLCLVYFFNMNALPYSYLFYTSTFLSLVILGWYPSQKTGVRQCVDD